MNNKQTVIITLLITYVAAAIGISLWTHFSAPSIVMLAAMLPVAMVAGLIFDALE